MTKSTGMGLYIAKKLCDKLGHKITVESEINEYTKITIIFTKNKYYKIVIFCNIRITTNPILLYYTVKRKEKDYGKYLKN